MQCNSTPKSTKRSKNIRIQKHHKSRNQIQHWKISDTSRYGNNPEGRLRTGHGRTSRSNHNQANKNIRTKRNKTCFPKARRKKEEKNKLQFRRKRTREREKKEEQRKMNEFYGDARSRGRERVTRPLW